MPDKIFTVSEISRDIRFTLENRFRAIWIEGEVSNLSSPGSGHHYFTLKDVGAQISCVMFRTAAQRNPVVLKNGQKVQVQGNVSVYEARGQYQVIVERVQASGAGELQAKFEALKQKLAAEGLFDQAKKKKIPPFPKTIVVVTSPTGAAIQDILKVMSRRAPWIHLIIAPVRVQGEGAAGEISRAIQYLSTRPEALPEIDTIIVARGGGSMEDLWSFNEEIVARAIFACPIPIISGVGHEIDYTIADFVADRREPTPSAAAEAAVPDGIALKHRLGVLQQRLDGSVESHFRHLRRMIEAYQREMAAREPARKVQNWAQSLDYLAERMENVVNRRIEAYQAKLHRFEAILSARSPERELQAARDKSARAMERLSDVLIRRIEAKKERLVNAHHLLKAIGPDKTLKRGFSMTLDEKGKPILSATGLKVGQKIITRFADGEAVSRVEKKP